jgi:cytochrome c553
MINHRFPTVFGFLVVLAALAAPANAAAQGAAPHIPERPALATPGNTAEAAAILGAKLLVCNACHGGDGVPRTPATPVIWGQQENFLLKQLNDFHSGDRENDVMNWMATALSQAELASAANFFAKKTWPAKAAGAASTSAPAQAALCQICHQQNFVGGPIAPRLAGQNYGYLIEAMRRYAEGERASSNPSVPMLQRNVEMVKIMEAIPAADRDALARYISGL